MWLKKCVEISVMLFKNEKCCLKCHTKRPLNLSPSIILVRQSLCSWFLKNEFENMVINTNFCIMYFLKIVFQPNFLNIVFILFIKQKHETFYQICLYFLGQEIYFHNKLLSWLHLTS